MDNKNLKKRGFVALLGVLIINAIILLVSIGTVSRAVDEVNSSLGEQYFYTAWSVANSCAEKALANLAATSSYSGGEILDFDGNSCVISSVTDLSGIKTFTTYSTVSGYSEIFEVGVSTTTPRVVIDHWVDNVAYDLTAVLPTITVQPQSPEGLVICEDMIHGCGGFSVGISGGTLPITYQWQWQRIYDPGWKNATTDYVLDSGGSGSPMGFGVSSVSSSSYAFALDVYAPTDSYDFRVVISNPAGTVTSNSATFIVAPPNPE
jgi:hypothetical protein